MGDSLAYQEYRRWEMLKGEVRMMAPASVLHTYIADNILSIFKRYLKGKHCVPFGDGLLVQLTAEDKFVPDMMIVCDRSKIKRTYIDGTPDLVVEVLSPSTAKSDRGYKKDVYERSGVPEYWIVNHLSKSIEVYLLKNNRYVLDNIYILCSVDELQDMTDEEKSKVISEFKCHLYEDLVISLEDIFDNSF